MDLFKELTSHNHLSVHEAERNASQEVSNWQPVGGM